MPVRAPVWNPCLVRCPTPKEPVVEIGMRPYQPLGLSGSGTWGFGGACTSRLVLVVVYIIMHRRYHRRVQRVVQARNMLTSVSDLQTSADHNEVPAACAWLLSLLCSCWWLLRARRARGHVSCARVGETTSSLVGAYRHGSLHLPLHTGYL